jgi:mevalonate kinase
MRTPAHGRAGGKVILLGEHAVVYGRPAVATGIPLAVEVTIDTGAGPRLVSDESSDADARGTRLVTEAARRMGLDPSRLVVTVRSQVPLGRGLGSSAALAVAVLRGMATAAGRDLDTQATLEHGRALEQIFHGTPSGIDPAAAALGTCIRFVRGEPPTVTALRLDRTVRLLVTYGDRARSTGAAVGGLRDRWEADRTGHERLFDDIARAVDEGVAALERGDVEALGAAFDRNQTVLEALGVSNDEVAARVAAAKAAGALGAKLTGGGAGGAVIAVAHDAEMVATALRRTGTTTFIVDVSGAGERTFARGATA